ncbi:MAG: hypothetical protein QXI12_05765 [Candidatus Methanomethyliaceae archaeon]
MMVRQHKLITGAVLKFYDLPPQFVVFAEWPDKVPLYTVVLRRGRLWYVNRKPETHHEIDGDLLMDEFLMNVQDAKAGLEKNDRLLRIASIANMVKLTHLIQDGCVAHDYEAGEIIKVRWEWVKAGYVREFWGSPEDMFKQVLRQMNKWNQDLNLAVAKATELSSASMKIFLKCAGWNRRT